MARVVSTYSWCVCRGHCLCSLWPVLSPLTAGVCVGATVCVVYGPCCLHLQLVCVSGPLCVVLLLALLVYSHTAVPLATHALTNFYSDSGSSEVKDATLDILQSELASPLVSGRADFSNRKTRITSVNLP